MIKEIIYVLKTLLLLWMSQKCESFAMLNNVSARDVTLLDILRALLQLQKTNQPTFVNVFCGHEGSVE